MDEKVTYPTLENYDKNEFEIESTVLKKYKGNSANVFIPMGVTEIGFYSMSDNKTLKNVTMPNSVIKIGANAFDRSAIENIKLSDNLKIIGDAAFSDCFALKKIKLPDGLEAIWFRAFGGSGLEEIVIPSSVKEIDEGLFAGCNDLISISVAPENKNYFSENNCLIERATKTLVAGCKKSTIPTDGSVTKIGERAFESIRIKHISIPNCITHIGEAAFEFTNLTEITIPNSVIYIEKEAFYLCENLESAVISINVANIGEEAFGLCDDLEEVTMPKCFARDEQTLKNIFDGCEIKKIKFTFIE